MRNLVLSVKRSEFRSDDPKSVESDAVYKKLKPSILKDGDYTCEFCGFKSDKRQHIHHLDDNHNNNKRSNLVIACSLCHMCCHIGFAGEKSLGDLIYLEQDIGIKQADLNNIIRFLWIGQESKDSVISEYSENMLDRFYNMTTHARRILRTNDLSVFGDFLMSLSDRDYKAREEKIKGFYFLPNKEGFKADIDVWKKQNGIPDPKLWFEIAKKKSELIFE